MIIRASNIPISLDAMLPESEQLLRREVARALGVKPQRLAAIDIVRRSIDARKKGNVHFSVSCDVDMPDLPAFTLKAFRPLKGVCISERQRREAVPIPDVGSSFEASGRPRPVVVGAGPAGLFCALYLARAGMQPILIERGEPVDRRQQAIRAFDDGGALNLNSNIQFGEGGAGTFSDGKLTTGTKDRHIRDVLEEFVSAGAPEDILIDAKPHIGTDHLPKVVSGIRTKIVEAGGEVRFDTQLIGLTVERIDRAERLTSVAIRNIKTGVEEELPCDTLVLAIGHSARDTIAMLLDAGLCMERKPFAMGVRIEHPQQLIDEAQYGKASSHPALPPADYKLNVRTKDGRGVYTFCMCPGGTVVAAASEEGGVCVNGMSNYARDGENANSALLVEVLPEDLEGDDVLAGMHFQRDLERAAFLAAEHEGAYAAPAQTVGGFLGRDPKASVDPTYPRGVAWVDLRECLPPLISDAIEEALPKLDGKLHGFAHPDAVMTAVEARSSSPVRIIRDKRTLQSVSIRGIYPAGEGAGYAGGIMSAATDGIRVAERIIYELQLQEAARQLEEGEAIIFPTDTVYGLGIAVEHAQTPERLYELKSRSKDKPIAWLIGSPEELDAYGRDVPAYARKLAERFWPGPLTLVVKASDQVPEQFLSGAGTIGLRMPDSRIVLDLIQAVSSPLATTSANLSGAGDAADPSQLSDVLSSSVPCILSESRGASVRSDGRASSPIGVAAADRFDDQFPCKAIASTVIDCTGAAPKMIREGSITSADVNQALS